MWYIFFVTGFPTGEIDDIIYSVFQAKDDEEAKGPKIEALKLEAKEKHGIMPAHWSLFRAEIIPKGEQDRKARALPVYPAIATA